MSDTDECAFAEVDEREECGYCGRLAWESKVCRSCLNRTCSDCWHERDEWCRGCCESAGTPFPYRGEKWEQVEEA